MIPEESDEDLPVTVQGDGDEVDTIPYAPGDSEDEQFNMAKVYSRSCKKFTTGHEQLLR